MHGPDQDEHPPLLTERLRRLAAPIGILVAAMLVATLAFEGPPWMAASVAVGTVVVLLWLRARSRRSDERDYGPGAG